MTTALAYMSSDVPKTKITRIAAPQIVFSMACTPQVIHFAARENEYTDEQFHADLTRSNKRLDAMAAEALRDEAEGRTREFPV